MFGQYETLICEVQDEILHLTLNRPDKLNALNQQVLTELKNVLGLLINDKTFCVKGVLFTGAGDKAFIAGADIKGMSQMSAAEAEQFGALGQEVSEMFEALPIPVLACVNGFALGGGCEMAMSCDFIYATESAVFGQPEINLALIPGFGGTQRLTRFVGMARAKELIYTGRNINAQQAREYGLVQELFTTKEEMMAAALKFFAVIKKKSPLIVAQCKDVIQKGEALDIHQGLLVERRGFRAVFETEDKSEGLAAFLEKRQPQFKGK